MRRSKNKSQMGAGGQRYPRYLFPYVCFRCRKSYKRVPAVGLPDKKCPECGGAAIGLYRKFKPPPRNDDAQWKKVEYLVAHGFRFFSQRTSGGETIPYPKTLAEAREFVRRFGGSKR